MADVPPTSSQKPVGLDADTKSVMERAIAREQSLSRMASGSAQNSNGCTRSSFDHLRCPTGTRVHQDRRFIPRSLIAASLRG
jgi:hypothetical protein